MIKEHDVKNHFIAQAFAQIFGGAKGTFAKAATLIFGPLIQRDIAGLVVSEIL